jgi:hypothetical protein
MVVGGVGEFTVWIGDRKIAEKISGRFPDPDTVVTTVRSLSA